MECIGRRRRVVAARSAGQGQGQENNPRDRPLEPWRRPASQKADELVRWVTSIFEHNEKRFRPRQRRRRPADQKVLEGTVAALICDAIHRDLTSPGGRVMLPLSNQKLGTRSRYRAPVYSKQLPQILELLDGDILDRQKGHQAYFGEAKQTTIALADRFKGVVESYGIGLSDLRREQGGELLILKRSKEDYWDGGGTFEYDDTPTTNAFRAEVQRINARLASLDLTLDLDHPRARKVDLRERSMRRIFNNARFDHGGRLWGGFWQELSKRDRAAALLLDGDRAVTLDYRQMGPRLLYGRAGVSPPTDCYAVPGYEGYRSGWKKLLNAMFFSGPDLPRLPKGTADLLPPRIGVRRATELLLEHNAPITPLVQENVGFEVMFMESEVLIDVVMELESREIAALPIHDAVIVADVARQSGWERQRQSGWPFWRSRRGDDCRGATITQALFVESSDCRGATVRTIP